MPTDETTETPEGVAVPAAVELATAVPIEAVDETPAGVADPLFAEPAEAVPIAEDDETPAGETRAAPIAMARPIAESARTPDANAPLPLAIAARVNVPFGRVAERTVARTAIGVLGDANQSGRSRRSRNRDGERRGGCGDIRTEVQDGNRFV